MAKPNLRKLNPMDFTKMNPTRQAKIEAAPAAALPDADSYKPNPGEDRIHLSRRCTPLRIRTVVLGTPACTYDGR